MEKQQRKDFRHPYEPYDVQYELMIAIYETIRDGKVGIFESPTGTGKSLSLICSSLTWLREHQEGSIAQSSTDGTQDIPSWAVDQAFEQRRKAAIDQKAATEDRLRDARRKERRRAQASSNGGHTAKRQRIGSAIPREAPDLSQFELEDYDGDDDGEHRANTAQSTKTGFSTNSIEMMEKLGLIFKPEAEDVATLENETKIIYCSRTHSQLTQFVQELRRVTPKEPFWLGTHQVSNQATGDDKVDVRHLPLGSRKNLCINAQVQQLGAVSAMNERCIELQQPDTKKEARCSFLPTQENEAKVSELRDETLAKIRDIEDLADLGREHAICPYYASRTTINPSEIVTLPYPLLLQKSAREASGLSLRDHVVVIDEAHNLIDVVSNIHSCSISLAQIQECRESVRQYLQKFRHRLKGKNRVYVAQLVRLLDSLANFLSTKLRTDSSVDGEVVISELMAGKGADQINLHQLMIYLQQSRLARKVGGYVQHQAQQEGGKDGQLKRSTATPALMNVHTFLQVLTNPAAEGRFFFEKNDQNDVALKYLLLDPVGHFRDIVDEARAVILAGGTMSPLDDFVHQLFPYLGSDRLRTWSCGHIMPPTNLVAMPLRKSEGGVLFDFTYSNRNSSHLIEALGDSLISLSTCVPDGVVVFFPSYAYLTKIVTLWQSTNNGNQWRALERTKPIFQESKGFNVDELLASYTKSIDSSKGGLLLAVVGGKLSEGINFSDRLGRAVVVVGLPFPNAQSAQWKAKLDYIQQSTIRRTGKIEDGKEASRNMYENACMRAVNQSIGRAIRHKGDYAAIILLDQRYSTPRISSKLPAWIRASLVGEGHSLSIMRARLQDFFQSRKH